MQEDELLDALVVLHPNFDLEHAQKRLAGIDKDDALIEVEEFIRFYAYQFVHHHDHKLFDLVKYIHPRRAGYIQMDEIEQYVEESGTKIDSKILNQIKELLGNDGMKIADFVTEMA